MGAQPSGDKARPHLRWSGAEVREQLEDVAVGGVRVEQVRESWAERRCQPDVGHQYGRVLAALDGAEGDSGDAGRLSELVLRQPANCPQEADAETEGAQVPAFRVADHRMLLSGGF